MADSELRSVADGADMIVRGYAFTRRDGLVYVLNLVDGLSAMVIDPDGTMLETNMDDIEQEVVRKIWKRTRNTWSLVMPKYFRFKVCGYYLYYTSFCLIGCMHAHASDSKLTESASAKIPDELGRDPMRLLRTGPYRSPRRSMRHSWRFDFLS